MPRAKTGTKRSDKHKKILKAVKGYKLTRSKHFKRANEAYLKAGEEAFAGRRIKRRDLRTLWIQRIGAALSEYGLKYGMFISALKKNKITLDRKILSDLGTRHPKVFKAVVESVKTKE
ncbi:50S ribosomal protein L20 [candidate division WWE3 bacterium CG08_land_8_20_14_0_20_40_13]|uniref:Large ribosomal subunit protein bL20 n=1 Tax=candidate division WWE3 bacterium CG08_land_8_20_14_0_20_40_13 TaxID=1975084 RepID=A0A2H0XE41_UNCKA|nr:MAG: 50S ribosomal protein L20 [candidate division WWE3 bacterium CG08_land_8_20_14_0_20_40_13]